MRFACSSKREARSEKREPRLYAQRQRERLARSRTLLEIVEDDIERRVFVGVDQRVLVEINHGFSASEVCVREQERRKAEFRTGFGIALRIGRAIGRTIELTIELTIVFTTAFAIAFAY